MKTRITVLLAALLSTSQLPAQTPGSLDSAFQTQLPTNFAEFYYHPLAAQRPNKLGCEYWHHYRRPREKVRNASGHQRPAVLSPAQAVGARCGMTVIYECNFVSNYETFNDSLACHSGLSIRTASTGTRHFGQNFSGTNPRELRRVSTLGSHPCPPPPARSSSAAGGVENASRESPSFSVTFSWRLSSNEVNK
jgi:hypothetical protein